METFSNQTAKYKIRWKITALCLSVSFFPKYKHVLPVAQQTFPYLGIMGPVV